MSGQFSWTSCLPIKNHYTTKYNKNANNNVINSVFFIGTSKRVLKHILLVEARLQEVSVWSLLHYKEYKLLIVLYVMY